mgnify:CR=1 FL=1
MNSGSVEWLQAIELERDLTLSDWNKAKEMEKEQMIDWYATGQADTVNMYEQHLNKTLNTNEK